jgi:hypothetical protein
LDAARWFGGNNFTLKTTRKHWQSRTKRDLIIEVWEALDCESVGEDELERIQEVLHEVFGAGAIESPAAIARVVADEGAALRHPEVFECDLKWRAGNGFHNLDFSGIESAVESFKQVELQRRELEQKKDKAGLLHLNEMVAAARQDSLLLVRSKILGQHERAEAKEASEWLRIWLVAPELFRDWLELRMRSAEFQQRFGDANSPLRP